jgi:hypothetical protein
MQSPFCLFFWQQRGVAFGGKVYVPPFLVRGGARSLHTRRAQTITSGLLLPPEEVEEALLERALEGAFFFSKF